jgi:hypothetical protein
MAMEGTVAAERKTFAPEAFAPLGLSSEQRMKFETGTVAHAGVFHLPSGDGWTGREPASKRSETVGKTDVVESGTGTANLQLPGLGEFPGPNRRGTTVIMDP